MLRRGGIALILAAIEHSGYTFRHERIKLPVPVDKLNPMMTPRTARIFAELQSPMGEFARALIEKHPLSRIVNKPV